MLSITSLTIGHCEMLKHDKRDCMASQFLLIPNIFVGRQQHLKTRLLGNVDQLAVSKFFPSPPAGFINCMPHKKAGKAARCAVL
jgi:hypothetical protein